jgi:hypothetical protein
MSEYREWSRRASARGAETTEVLRNKQILAECLYLIREAENRYRLACCGGGASGWAPIVREWCNMTGELEIWLAAA